MKTRRLSRTLISRTRAHDIIFHPVPGPHVVASIPRWAQIPQMDGFAVTGDQREPDARAVCGAGSESSSDLKWQHSVFAAESTPAEGRRWLIFTLFGGTAILLTTLSFGFEYDHGDLQYVAWSALNGHWPYSGAWETSFPGGILIHALVLALGGQSALAFRAFDLIVQILTLGLIFKGTQKISGPLAGSIAALLYAVAYVQGGAYHTAQRDGFMVPLILIALFSLWRFRDSQRVVLLGVAGFALGVVCVIKPTYAVLVAAITIVLVFWRTDSRTAGVRLIRAGCFALCGSLPLLFVLFVLFRQGEMTSLIEISTFLKTVYVHLERSSQLRVLLATLYVAPAVVSIGVVASLLPGVKRGERFWSVVGLGAVCLVVRMIEAKSYSYQYWPIVATLVMLSGVGWAFILRATASFVDGSTSAKRIAVALVVTVMVGASLLTDRGTVEGFLAFGGRMKASLERPVAFDSLVAGSEEQAAIARYLNHHSQPGDTVQLWGAEPAVLYAAQRRSPSRFFTSSPFLCRHARFFEHCDENLIEVQRRWKREFLDAVNEVKPLFIVAHLASDEESLAISEGARYAPDFPQLREIIGRNYSKAETFGAWTVFRRNGK